MSNPKPVEGALREAALKLIKVVDEAKEFRVHGGDFLGALGELREAALSAAPAPAIDEKRREILASVPPDSPLATNWGTILKRCKWCDEGNSRIQSSVSEKFVHHTSVGRVLCELELRTKPAAPARDGVLESLASEVAARNSWREPLLCFMEIAPVLPSSGSINEIGKIKEWRVGLNYGRNLDDIECGFNYFGETPEEAIEKARVALACAAKEQADGQ